MNPSHLSTEKLAEDLYRAYYSAWGGTEFEKLTPDQLTVLSMARKEYERTMDIFLGETVNDTQKKTSTNS